MEMFPGKVPGLLRQPRKYLIYGYWIARVDKIAAKTSGKDPIEPPLGDIKPGVVVL